jgi:hypothetical protein
MSIIYYCLYKSDSVFYFISMKPHRFRLNLIPLFHQMASTPRLTLSDGHLKEEGPVFGFTTVDEANSIVEYRRDEDQEQGKEPLIFFQNIPYDAYQGLYSEGSPIPHCASLYLTDFQTLRVKLPTNQHCSIAGHFGIKIYQKAEEMGLGYAISIRKGATAHMGGVRKRPDGCWGPKNKPYVTLTLEVGTSEMEQSIALDAHRWMESPDSHVHQVVTIKTRSDRPMLMFQRWERGSRRSGRVTVTQETAIWLEDGQPRTCGRLTIRFSQLFERDAVQGRSERDMGFDAEDLFYIARDGWRLLGHLPWDDEE